MRDIQILDEPLTTQSCHDAVSDPSAGGIVVFVGAVRNQTKGRKVLQLAFESYVPMALKEMGKIADSLSQKWGILHVSIHHRVGVLEIGEIPVIIAVSTPHRQAAFEACQYAIDTLKETVPIWKKEIFEDGTVWVSAHP
jgi:molybdopterin synthase catalytic subunit